MKNYLSCLITKNRVRNKLLEMNCDIVRVTAVCTSLDEARALYKTLKTPKGSSFKDWLDDELLEFGYENGVPIQNQEKIDDLLRKSITFELLSDVETQLESLFFLKEISNMPEIDTSLNVCYKKISATNQRFFIYFNISNDERVWHDNLQKISAVGLRVAQKLESLTTIIYSLAELKLAQH